MADPPNSAGFCITCGYPLQGLTNTPEGFRCPECGRKFDPADVKTFRKTPHRALTQWLAKPVGWWTTIFAVAAAVGVMAVSRWKISTFEPSYVDLVYYFNPSALRHRTSLVTGRDYIFTISMLVAAGVFVWCVLRTVVGMIVRWRGNFGEDEPVHVGRRHALMAIASVVTAGGAALGWPYRLAQQWVARRLTANNVKPASQWALIPVVAPPTVLSASETTITLRAAVIELPQVAQRMAGLKLLIEDNAKLALPILIEAVSRESDSSMRALELRLIGLHRDKYTIDFLLRFMGHSDAETRVAAIDALGMVHAPAFDVPLPFVEPYTSKLPATAGPVPIQVDSLLAPSPRSFNPHLPMDPISIPANVHDQLKQMMLASSFTQEREAAARALLRWQSDSYTLRVAEWGVWINDRGELKLLQSLLDEIPSFVHRTGNPLSEFDDRINPITMVDKPVIHITADQVMVVDLSVVITEGRPWYAYPKPDDFTVNVETQYDRRGWKISDAGLLERPHPPPQLSPLENTNLEKLSDVRQGFPWLTPAHASSGPEGAGGAFPSWNEVTSIGLRWQSLIVSPARLPWMTLPEVGDDPKFAWWKGLREVPSAWVSSRGESERFLYYDGPTLERTPLTVSLAGNNLTFLKQGSGWIDACLLIRVNQGKLSGQTFTISKEAWSNEPFSAAVDADNLHEQQVIEAFRQMLTTSGLSTGEANGLIQAWSAQFFRAEGARFLMLFSGGTYELFCPIEIRPKPTEMVRVGIILTEFGK